MISRNPELSLQRLINRLPELDENSPPIAPSRLPLSADDEVVESQAASRRFSGIDLSSGADLNVSRVLSRLWAANSQLLAHILNIEA